MKLLLLISALLWLNPNTNGRYEVQIETQNGETVDAYITLQGAGPLLSAFDSKENFGSYLLNNQRTTSDSLTFYSNFHCLKYPNFRGRKENLVAITPTDCFKMAASDIRNIAFKSFTPADDSTLETPLEAAEIDLLQQAPLSTKKLMVDLKLQKTELNCSIWLVSYNESISEMQTLRSIKLALDDYRTASATCAPDKKLELYKTWFQKWRTFFKANNMLLLEIAES